MAMAPLTVADLKDLPSIYQSPRSNGDVLVGEDAAHLIVEASTSGNDSAMQSLLLQTQYIKIILEKPHTIYYQERPSEGPDDEREVMAMRLSNVERALAVAVQNGHPAVVSLLLAFALQQKMDLSDVITRSVVNKAIGCGPAAIPIFKALASADPTIINFPLGHGAEPLYEAVRRRQPYALAALLEIGADPLQPVARSKELGTYNSSLMSRAAISEYPYMIELLLKHGTPIAGTGALHTTTCHGRLDTMRLLIQHGADLNEVIIPWRKWTPMHFAASRGQVDAMGLLVQSGARSDLKDEHSKTAAELLEERS